LPDDALLLPILSFAADSPAPAAAPTGATAAAPARLLPAGSFGTVSVYIPTGTPQSVAIFLSGDGGWNLGVVNMAQALRNKGAVVIGVDVTHYLAALRGKAACRLIAGDFENLSHQIQKKIALKEYHVPVLLGYSSGATVVYAALVHRPVQRSCMPPSCSLRREPSQA
jgi:type IV secretory pathway VirJ component